VTAIAITDDHLALAAVARSMLANHDAVGAAGAALNGDASRPAFWKEAVGLGWLGLHVEEVHGGQGYGLPELAVVVEELGRCVAPGPFLPTAVLAAAVQARGDDDSKTWLLPDLVTGARTAGIALRSEATVTPGETAIGPLITGRAAVLCGDRSDLIAVVVGEDLVVVSMEETGITSELLDAVDPSRPTSAISFAATPVLAILPDGARAARRLTWVLAAAEAAGGMAAITEATVLYSHARRQFGRQIGGFMAVKHHLVDMLAAAELGAAAAWDAARCDGDLTGEPEAELAAAIAATQAVEGYRRVASKAIQVHGGIGYTWEHETNLHFRRAAALSVLVNDAGNPADTVCELRRKGTRRRIGLDLPPEAAGYRADAEAFLATLQATPEADQGAWWGRSGYLTPHWPQPFGRGADPVEQLVIDEVLSEVDRPQQLGLGEWLLPSLLEYGTPEQIERWMWPSLEGRMKWCQLFSEPDAGSDAAAVSTRATKVDGGWRVTGQKVWTSQAHESELGLATIRTNTEVAKHKGITMMLIDMHADGVDVRPITELSGEQLFNEVFFDDVFVPDDHVIGPVDGGWTVARAALGNERVSISHNPASMVADALLDRVEHCAEDHALLRRLGGLLAESHSLRMLNVRSAARLVEDGSMGVEGSLGKLVGAEHAQRIVDLGLDMIGTAALVGQDEPLVRDYFFTRCLTIAGGTSEVLRSQIGELVLGLPREPLPGLPFPGTE
jgi:alkylation response protein AidB-like acyl-CoA dehydrogenase